MPNYSGQLIVDLLNGRKDQTVWDDGDLLASKGGAETSETVYLNYGEFTDYDYYCRIVNNGHRELLKKCNGAEEGFRLYIVGHGNWKNQTVAGFQGMEVALFISGLPLQAYKVISIVSCGAGADKGAADSVRMTNSADSFAQKFALALYMQGHSNLIYARIGKVAFTPSGKKGTALPGEDAKKKRSGSKIAFRRGANGSPVRSVVVY